jgi:hypothetical protein
MSYLKTSVIGGYKADDEYTSTARNGHWKIETARRVADRMNIVRGGFLAHTTADLSGHGRGSWDGKWDLSSGEQTSDYEDHNDSGEIHDICDEVEGRT